MTVDYAQAAKPLAQQVLKRYEKLTAIEKTFPNLVTPEELGAVLTRLQDGTINRAGAKALIKELARRNREFLDGLPALTKTLERLEQNT